jgi:hypothetical protein
MMSTRTQLATQASDDHSALAQQLLTVAIYAGALRAAIDQPLPERERQTLAEQLERVETMRHALENQVRPLERTRVSWWRRLCQQER